MVIPHGGGFTTGSSQDLGLEGLIKRFVSRGILVITVQYRLGIYGSPLLFI